MSATRTVLNSTAPGLGASAPRPGAPHQSSTLKHGHFTAHGLDYARIAIVVAAIVAYRIHALPAIGGFDLVGVAAALAGGYSIFHKALRDMLARRMTMDLSVSIALIAALSIREVFTANVIIVFVLMAGIIEAMTIDRGHRAVEDPIGGLPGTAEVLRATGAADRGAEGEVAVVDTATLRSGDIVLVRPGKRVPVDGLVIEGSAFIDQSAITGELNPVEVARGSFVYAGSVSQSGALRIRTDSFGSQTVFERMNEALRTAGESQAPVQKLADRLAGYVVYFALACALLTLAISRDPRSTIAVIIVAAASGIAAGTPLAILGALGRAARMGAIVKRGSWMQKLGIVDTIVFDKTGTLTLGRAEVVEIAGARGIPAAELLRIAASAELYSEHPLARAILCKAAGLPVVQPRNLLTTRAGE